ncbi:class I SAM-dependent methyltransferase [Rhodococcus enclensis]|nr:class I SAM-dependent methyltransferase [Rhodococcus qingshengii]
MYHHNTDPWDFTHRWYEERKRALTMAILPRPHFRGIFEPGCSIGTLTALLVDRGEQTLASDLVDAAVTEARKRLSLPLSEGRVHIDRWSLRWSWPNQMFDLIVLSEVCFYFTIPEFEHPIDAACAHLDSGGVLVAAHWRHVVDAYPMTGDEVHERLRRRPDLRPTACYTDRDVLIETFSLAADPVRSVAEIEVLITPLTT